FPTHHVFMFQSPLPNSFLKNRPTPRLKAIQPSLNPLTELLFLVATAAGAPFFRDRSAWIRSANSFMSEPETSWIMPRPYWASGPDRLMSWVIFIFVPAPLRSSREVMTASAWPLPLSSDPLAFITIRLPASSRSVMSTSPLNDSDTGPILMWTLPLYCVSLTTSVSSAPGMQGATRRGSRRNCQTSSVEAGTVNSFSRWIAMCLLVSSVTAAVTEDTRRHMAIHLENEFTVPASTDEVWQFLLDPRRVAPCMPGAELTEVVSETQYKGKVHIKMGPVSLSFNGDVDITERDDAGKRMVMKAKGSELKGKGQADAVITS